ncbi:hypothetical protein GCM10010528_03800 [Gordonia defluvii]|uniref:Uncharacterized protein n=1 Tax=Gordonia defluvii TaxID=283718 RepID=A0ABN3YBV5_9ACTN|nr:hypothetical protein [Gordonia sp. UBA5067]
MKITTTKSTTRICVLATTLAVAATVSIGAGSASATTCSQWAFTGKTNLNQENGWYTGFTANGTKVSAPAVASAYHNRVSWIPFSSMLGDSINQSFGDATYEAARMHGTATGGIVGKKFQMTVKWSNGPVGIYRGAVQSDGYAKGTTYDAKAANVPTDWQVDKPLRCVKA